MTDKKAYTPPTMISETLTVGVFGNYGNYTGGWKKRRRRRWWWWLTGPAD